MAKAKNTESGETPQKKTPAKPKAAAPKATKAKAPTAEAAAAPAAPKKTPAKKAPATAATSKKSASAPDAAAPTTPLIDTGLAAQNAAAMLLNRPAAPTAPQPNKESSAFKSLKDQLAKPKPTGLSNLFGPTADQKKAAGHFNLHQQKGHAQTFGGLNKAGVPRRTNG
jgi:hypothetical protein